jgi:hypothetical protein
VAADTPGAATLGWLAGQTGGISATAAAELDSSLAQVAGDMDAYYELHLPPPPTDGRFHRVQISTTRAGLRVRAGPGYWAPLSSEVRALFTGTPAPLAPPRALRRSPLIDAWVGLRPGADGRLALSLSWIPASPAAAAARQLAVTARSEAGDLLFDARVAAVGQAGAARFAAPPGRILFDIDVLDDDGRVLDTDVRDVHVPQFTSDVMLALLPPEVLRARTVPEYRRIVQDDAAVPTPLRVFARSDRLVIRTPVWHAGLGEVHLRARVLNRRGQAMREVDRLEATADGLASFDLPLSWLAPGEYYLEVSAADGERVVGERILFRVTAERSVPGDYTGRSRSAAAASVSSRFAKQKRSTRGAGDADRNGDVGIAATPCSSVSRMAKAASVLVGDRRIVHQLEVAAPAGERPEARPLHQPQEQIALGLIEGASSASPRAPPGSRRARAAPACSSRT